MHKTWALQGLRSQRGYTFWTLVTNGAILAIFMLFALRIAPQYMTYMTVRDVIQRAADEYNPRENSLPDLRTKIRKLLQTSQVYAIKASDIKVYRERGGIFIDARYESRFPLFWIVDGVMKFDDLVVQIDETASR